MSVLKSILHHWNSASKAYDTLHPETEAAQVTDWHESVIGSLASKVLPTVVSELTTDSVMGKLMKLLLNASGVKYSINTNGYVCLGSFFGGLIIQWVYPRSNNAFSFPIAFTSNWTLIPCSEAPGTGYYTFLEVVRNGMTGATINTYSGSGQILDHTIRAIAIGW